MAPPADGGGYTVPSVAAGPARSPTRSLGRTDSQILGVDELLRRMEQMPRVALEALKQAMRQELEAVLSLAKKKAPVDSGRLRASGYVTPPEIEGGVVLNGEVGFSAEYAVYVHEKTEARHVVGEAKFLEKAINERSKGYAERLAARTRKLFESMIAKA
jgi:hypothetical protein